MAGEALKPKRIQLSRRKGWRLPANTVVVSRPSKWGNPFTMETARKLMPDATDAERLRKCLRAYSIWVTGMEDGKFGAYIAPLRDKNLACWCPLGSPCHADVLLEIANQ